jgi:hypothetical protein
MSIGHRAQVIGIDLLADDVVALVIHAKTGAGAAETFGEYNGCSTVQQAIRLVSTMIDRHCRLQIVVADHRESYFQRIVDRVLAKAVEFIDTRSPEPD